MSPLDVFEKVRETRPEIDGADENLASARSRLMKQIQTEHRPVRTSATRRRPWIIAGSLAGAAAAVTAGVLVAGNFATPGTVEAGPTPSPAFTRPGSEPTPRPVPDPVTVESVLRGAANVASTSSGPVAGEGQYLRIDTRTEHLVLHGPADGPPSDSTRADATAAWVAVGGYVTYIPADLSGEWVRVFERDYEIVALYGEDATALSQAWLDQIPKEPIIRRTPAGIVERMEGSTEPLQGEDEYYAQMPRDPEQLAEWVRAYNDRFNLEAGEAGIAQFLIEDLESNVAPADLRAAMYRVLGSLSIGVISGTEGSAVTLSFPGLNPDERLEISIDTTTALVTGTSMTYGSGGTVVPDAVPDFRTTQSLSIVDSAP